MEALKVVTPRARTRIFGLVVFLALAIGGSAIAAGALNPSVYQRVMCGIGALAGVTSLPRYWRQARNPTPTIALGLEGIEGNFGFLPWARVEQARVRHRFGNAPSLVNVVRFDLTGREHTLAPAKGKYASADFTGKSRLRDRTLEIPAWASRRAVLDDLQTYLPGRVAQ